MAKGKTTISTQGVLYIDGTEVENSFNNISKITGKLRRELRALSEGTEEWNKKAEELSRAEKRFTEVNDKIKETRSHLKSTGREVTSFNDLFFQMANSAKTNFTKAGGGIKGFGRTVKIVAAESWAAISSIPIVGWIAGIVGAVGLGFRQVLKYNDKVVEETGKLQNLFGGDFEGIDKLRIQIRALANTFELSFDEISNTVNTIYDSGLADTAEAIEAIKIGLATAPNKSAFLSQLESAADRAKQTGMSLQEAMNLNEAAQGSFMGIDMIYRRLERSNMRFQRGIEGNAVLIETFGKTFSEDLIRSVNTGEITTVQALEKIRIKTDETGLSAQQQAKLAAEFFGSRAANAAAYNEILGLIHEANKDQFEDLTALQEENIEFIELNERMEEAKDRAFNSDAMKDFRTQWDMLWKRIKTGYYNFIGWFVEMDHKFRFFQAAFIGGLKSIPAAFRNSTDSIRTNFIQLLQLFQQGGKVLKDIFTFKFSNVKESYGAFKEMAATFGSGLKKTANVFNDTLKEGGKEAAEKFNKDFQANIKAKEALEDKKNKQDIVPDHEDENKDDKKKREKALEDIRKAEEESYKKRLDLLAKFDAAKADLIEDSFEKQLAQERNRRAKEETAYTAELKDLLEKRAKAKTDIERENLDTSIKLLKDTEILLEEAHQNKLLEIQQKADAALFQAKIHAQQKQLELDRAKDEEEILAITSLNEAKELLQSQHYLKLTDQELRGIRTLEDAKAALREAADRKALQAQLKALQEQRDLLKKELEGLTGSAAEELKENLDELYFKILRVKTAIQGGEEEDQAKAVDDRDSELDQVDVLGFSAMQWEEMFANLDTTKDKLEALGMVFTALSNAGQMYSELIRGLNERDFRNFEDTQNRKQKELKRQLNEGWITNEEYQKRIQKIEAETANKKAEMDYKQAKADKIARMFAVVGETAVAVAKSLPNLGLAALVGALGGIQLGIVAAQPLPEKPSFAAGGHTGPGFGLPDSTGYKPAGIVHENEWVAPKWMLEEPRIARIIDYLESIRIGETRMMAEGGHTNFQAPVNVESTTSTVLQDNPRLLAVLERLENILVTIDEEGVTAFIAEDARTARRMLKMIDEFNALKAKNKH